MMQEFTQKIDHHFFSSSPSAKPDFIQHRVYGLDFDGCTNTSLARSKLNDDIVQYIVNHPEINSIAFIISSLRQSFWKDYLNAMWNPPSESNMAQSCIILEETLLPELKLKIEHKFKTLNIKRTPPTLKFHSFLLSDILNYLEDGTTLKKIALSRYYTTPPEDFITVKNRDDEDVVLATYNPLLGRFEKATETEAYKVSFELSDISKILLLWMQMQYFANECYDAPFIFRFVDDTKDILDNIRSFFYDHPELIPTGCGLEYMYMSSNHHHYPPEYEASEPIFGTGPAHKHYRGYVYDIALDINEANLTSNKMITDKIKTRLLTLNDDADSIVRKNQVPSENNGESISTDNNLIEELNHQTTKTNSSNFLTSLDDISTKEYEALCSVFNNIVFR